MSVAWVAFLLLIAALLALDLGVFHKRPHAIGIREAGFWTAVWVTVGVSFTIPVYLLFEHHLLGAHVAASDHQLGGDGLQAATIYLTAYLLEESLSIDNIFVIALVLDRFHVQREHRHRVLFWGIVGAIVLRGAMILGGLWLVERFSWIFYFFGAYLGWSGLQLLRGKDDDDEAEIESTFFVRTAMRVIPLETGPHGGKFVLRTEKGIAFTLLFLALVVVEWTDVVFAMDSIPAVLSVANEPFIIFTSNIFAIMGLRSLYFLLAGAIDRFEHLKYGLGVILVFIAVKMILHQVPRDVPSVDVVHIPHLVSLGFIVFCLAVSVTVSLVKGRGEAPANDHPTPPT